MSSFYTICLKKSLKTKSVDAFFGKTISVGLGNYYGEGFSDAFNAKKIARFDCSIEEAIVKVLNYGRADAAIIDQYVALHVIGKIGIDINNFAAAYNFKHPRLPLGFINQRLTLFQE